jgi:spore maturation protein CgeB
MELKYIKKYKVLCMMHKNQFGNKEKPVSAEYNGIYKALKLINKNTFFLETHMNKKTIYENNLKIISEIRKIKPDIIFCHQSSYEIYSETYKIIKKICNPILINWCSDDSWRYNQHSYLISKNFDYLVTTYNYAHEKNLKNNINSILSTWGCPDHWISKKKSKDYKYDVTFIGNPYMGRRNIINKLKEDGIKINCFGFGWNSTIKDSQISQVIQASKINLNFSKSKGFKKQTKARIFEITGAKGFCLTEKSDELKKYFKIKKQIEVFDSYHELKNKINYYLENQKKREKISKAGYIKCKKNFIYTNVIKKILTKVKIKEKVEKNSYKEEKLNKPKNNMILNIYKLIFTLLLMIFFSKKKSLSISRRLLFEIEWRLNKEKTYSTKGWCSRLFNYN